MKKKSLFVLLFLGIILIENVNCQVTVDQDKNVIVGSTIPSLGFKLNVNGNSKFHGDMIAKDISSEGLNGKIVLRNYPNGQELNIRPINGKSGFLSFSEESFADKWIVGIYPSQTRLYFASGSITSPTIQMMLDNNGDLFLQKRLGIGLEPQYALDVKSDGGPASNYNGGSFARFSNSNQGPSSIIFASAGKFTGSIQGVKSGEGSAETALGDIYLTAFKGSGTPSRLVLKNTGKVGIGDANLTDPQSELEVRSTNQNVSALTVSCLPDPFITKLTLKVNNDITNHFVFKEHGDIPFLQSKLFDAISTGSLLALNNVYGIAFSNSNNPNNENDLGMIFRNNNLGIGMLNPQSKIDVSGNINSTSITTTTITTNSLVTGSFYRPIKTITGNNYPVTLQDHTILVASTVNTTVLLPTAIGNLGLIYVIKKITGASITVTIQPQPNQGIDGQTNKLITGQNERVTIQSDGETWFIID